MHTFPTYLLLCHCTARVDPKAILFRKNKARVVCDEFPQEGMASPVGVPFDGPTLEAAMEELLDPVPGLVRVKREIDSDDSFSQELREFGVIDLRDPDEDVV